MRICDLTVIRRRLFKIHLQCDYTMAGGAVRIMSYDFSFLGLIPVSFNHMNYIVCVCVHENTHACVWPVCLGVCMSVFVA